MIWGIVLAAGFGRRIGAPKALLKIGEETFHRRTVRAFAEAGLPVIVVVSPQVEEALPPGGPGERRVLNPDPDHPSGMFGSVRLGVAAAMDMGATGAILLPVDHPRVTGEDIRAVRGRLVAGAAVVVARHGGRRGHPIGISRAVMTEIASDQGLTTLRDVVHRDPDRAVEVEVSEGAILGVNTPNELARGSSAAFR